MRLIWNLLALLGLITLIALGALYWQVRDFDPGAWRTYGKMFAKLLETGNAAEATVWRAKVAEGLTFDEVDESIKAVAIEHNIKGVGELPLGDQVAAMTGKPWRKLKIYMYCNPLTAAKMVDFSEAYSAYLPCRVTLLEDESGQLWIYTLDMDMMIHGGRPLPPDLYKEANRVKAIILDVLKRGASGDF